MFDPSLEKSHVARGTAATALENIFPTPTFGPCFANAFFELCDQPFMKDLPFELAPALELTPKESLKKLTAIFDFEPNSANANQIEFRRGLLASWRALVSVLEARETLGERNICFPKVSFGFQPCCDDWIQCADKFSAVVRSAAAQPRIQKTPLFSSIVALYNEFGIEGIIPEWVYVTRDWRDADELAGGKKKLSGSFGIFLGEFDLPSPLAFRTRAIEIERQPDDMTRDIHNVHECLVVQHNEFDDDSEITLPNPLILCSDGQLIWGAQCDWGIVDHQTEVLAQAWGLDEVLGNFIEERRNEPAWKISLSSLRTELEKAFRQSKA